MAAVALVALTLTVGPAQAQEPPPEAQQWADRIRRDYPHYQEITFQFLPSAPAGPPCPGPGLRPPPAGAPGVDAAYRARLIADPDGVSAACGALNFRSWMLRADLTSGDQRIFSPGWLRVVELPAGVSGSERVAAMVRDGAVASKAFHAVAPAGRFLVDLHLPCAASGVTTYDIADLVVGLRTAPDAHDVTAVAVSPCGRTWFSLESADDLVKRAQEPREYWGLDFPEARDRARQRGGARQAD
jgi:hypothetical protein